MSQRFYEQYIKEYLPIARMSYLSAYTRNDLEAIEKIKESLFKLRSLKEWQKESLWKIITKG